MIKNHSNKAMDAGKTQRPVAHIKCVRECWAVGLGAFAVGDVVADADIIEKLTGNPNFVEITEEA